MWRKKGGSRVWQEGREHGKRRHLVQYERHWMEEQRTGDSQEGGGARTSTSEGAGRGEVKLHAQAKMDKKRGRGAGLGR